MIDASDMARAQYDNKAHRDGFGKSCKYDFCIHLGEDGKGEYCYIVTITRKADGVVLHNSYQYSLEDAESTVSDWRVRL
jgi:hypothetical protein